MNTLGAVIFAGGLGTRLRQVTGPTPKALAPLLGGTLLDHQLARLERLRPAQIVVLACYGADAVRQAVGNRAEVVVEESPLGTAGGLALLPRGCSRWLTLNVDHVSDVDLDALLAAHRPPCTACVTEVPVRIDQGVVDLDGDRMVAWRERPLVPFTVTTGLYVFSDAALRQVATGQRLDMPDLVRALVPHGVTTWMHRGTWFDAGTPDRLAQAEAWLRDEQP